MTTILIIIGAVTYAFVGLTLYNFMAVPSGRDAFLAAAMTLAWPIAVVLYALASSAKVASSLSGRMVNERYDLPRKLGEWLWRRINGA